jgi:membrane-associated protein
MEDIWTLVRDYGPWLYGLLFVYTFTKSGALPLLAGYAAQAGALDLVLVGAATFAGGYLGDETRFWLARRYGAAWLARRPRLFAALARASSLFERHGSLYIFVYRYPKGMRTIGAFPIGLTSLRWRIFTGLNAASAALWTLILVGAGYRLGPQIEEAVRNGFGAVSLVLLVLFLAAAGLIWWRRSPRQDAVGG